MMFAGMALVIATSTHATPRTPSNDVGDPLTFTVSPPQFASPPPSPATTPTICLGDLWGPGTNGSNGESGVTLTWANSGTSGATLDQLTIAGPDASMFYFDSTPDATIELPSPTSQHTNTLFFKSGMAALNVPRTYNATVTWKVNGEGSFSQDFEVPTLDDVTGINCDATGSNCGVTSISFPETKIGSSNTQSISVLMCGDREGEVTATIIQPDGQTAFEVISSSTQDISGNDSSVDVQFTPNAGGAFHAMLVVNVIDIGTNSGQPDSNATATGNQTLLTIDLFAGGTGAGTETYYQGGCLACDSPSGTGAVLLSFVIVVGLSRRRRRIDSTTS